MADEEQLALLKQGVDVWNAWRKAHPEIRPRLDRTNLEGANLTEACLEGANLTEAHLKGANLTEAHLEGANLTEAHLKGADLRKAHLKGAEFYGADLYGADLYGADLREAYLSGANLEGANLEGANLHGANLYGANLSETNLYRASLGKTNLYGANLKGMDLREAYLYGANLSEANLSEANLHGASLHRASLSGAEFYRADLSEADLYGADFGGAYPGGPNVSEKDLSEMNISDSYILTVEAYNVEARLYRANLSGAHLRGVNLYGTHLRGANLSGADLRGAYFFRADLYGADLSRADLHGANLSGADLSGTNLSGTNLSGANLSDTNLSGADLEGAIVDRTSFSNIDLSTVIGLESVVHRGPSTISIDTLYRSGGKIPLAFLRGCGIPDSFIEYIPALIGAMQPIQYHSCFISYSTADDAFARRLHERMRAVHLRVWFAPEDAEGGKKLYEQIDRAIQLHDRLLLVLSEASIQSNWVTTEIRRARAAEQKEQRRKLFPIRLTDFDTLRDWTCFDSDSGTDLAAEVRAYFIPDFSHWKDHDAFEAAFAGLLRDLRAAEQPRPSAHEGQ